MYKYKSIYIQYEVCNYKRGAKLVRYDYSEVLCVVCVNSKSAYTSVRSIYNIRVYNCKCKDICKT